MTYSTGTSHMVAIILFGVLTLMFSAGMAGFMFGLIYGCP